MATAISTKLIANVVDSIDFDMVFPAPALNGLVALDVYVEKGEISVGKNVVLASKSEREEIAVKGIELKSNPADPNKVRVLCSKPKMIQFPLRDDCEWTISEA